MRREGARFVRFAIGALVLLVGASPVRATPPATNLSQSATESGGAVVAAEGSLVVVAWIESENLTDGLRATIVASRSIDGGDSFSAPTVVAALTGFAAALDVRIATGVVHMSWLASSFTIGEPEGVDYARSLDGGVSYGPVLAINGLAPPGIADMAVDGANIAVVWSARGDAYFTHSLDGGTSFDAPVAVGLGVVDGTARVALTRDSVVAAWIGHRVDPRYVVSGFVVPFSSPVSIRVPIEIATSTELIRDLNLAAEAANVFAVWTSSAGGVRGLYGSRSFDAGEHFSPSQRLVAAGTLAFPRLVLEPGVAHIVCVSPTERLNFLTLRADSELPSVSRRLGQEVTFPDLTAREGTVALVWTSGSGRSSRLEYSVGDDERGPKKVRTLAGRNAMGAGARIAAAGGVAYAVWTEPVGETRDVFVARVAAPRAR